MNELTQKKLLYGIFLGMAISSRFLLSFNMAMWAQVISTLLLFFLISAMFYWLRQLRELLPEKQLTFKTTVLFSFQLFVVAAIFSSLVKYFYFTHIKAWEFQQLVDNSALIMEKELKYPAELVKESIKYITPAAFAVASAIMNSLGGVILGIANWFFFKKEQELRKRM